MIKGLIALFIVAAAHVCVAKEFPVPVFRQPYGVGETRIIGGEPAKRGQFPHQAGVTMDGSYFCGGSLISKNWVLTAGHCVDGFRTWAIVLGQTDRQASESGLVTVTSKKGISHEDYEPSIVSNDVAVIQLPEDVQSSEFIKPIALPPRSLKDKNLDGKTVRVSGWGRTSDSDSGISPILRWVDLELINFEQCKKIYGDVLTPTKYCCSGADKKSTCNGDSGGSLTIGEGAELVNLGIVSFGSRRGCAKGYPTGFTATPYFVDWISNKTGIPIKD